MYNDNIFHTARDRKEDFVTRFSPGISAGYESEPLTLKGGYTFDGELYAQLSDLNSAVARQTASIDLRYLPTRLLTLAAKGEYAETQTPGELNLVTGLPTERTSAHRFLLDPSITYRSDPLTTETVGYTFTKDTRKGGVTTDTHVGRLGLDRKVTSVDTAILEYVFREFTFDRSDRVRAHAITPGWKRELTPLTTFSIRAGPRFSEGSVDAEILTSLRRALAEGEIVLTYTRSQTTVVGEAGSVRANTGDLAVKYKILPLLELSLTPSYSRSTRSGFETNVYRIKFGATYEITRWLSLVGSYEYSLEKGVLKETTAARRRDEIPNSIVLLGLVAKLPTRIY